MVREPKKTAIADTIPQARRFEEAARALGCDEDPAHFDEALKKVARHKPAVPKPEEPKRRQRKERHD